MKTLNIIKTKAALIVGFMIMIVLPVSSSSYIKKEKGGEMKNVRRNKFRK